MSDLLFGLPHEVFALCVGTGTSCILWGFAARRKRPSP